ncbi:glycosyltransferase family 4 protein [Caldiplasma sukawensis]
MRVLISAYSGLSSGIGTYTLEIANLMSKHVDVTLLSLDAEINDFRTIKLKQKFVSRGAPLLTFINIKSDLKKITGEYDVVHDTLPPYGIGSKHLITTKWNYKSALYIGFNRTLWQPFPENIGGFPVTLQHYIMDNLSKKESRYEISVNQSGENFIPPPMRLGNIKDYGDLKILKIIFVSRDLNIKRKNLSVIINALKYVKRKVELHVVGMGIAPGILHGFLNREKLIELMKEMDVLILPSLYEEIGYVGLEAYSIGLPVITSDISSFRNILKESPKFNPYDSYELAKILEGLSETSLKMMGKRSFEFLKSINAYTEHRILNLYKKINEL